MGRNYSDVEGQFSTVEVAGSSQSQLTDRPTRENEKDTNIEFDESDRTIDSEVLRDIEDTRLRMS